MLRRLPPHQSITVGHVSTLKCQLVPVCNWVWLLGSGTGNRPSLIQRRVHQVL